MSKFLMRATVVLTWLLLPLAVRAATPEVGKDALRKLVKLPTITFQSNWNFDSDRGFVLGSAGEDAAAQITSLRKELKRNLSDAARYQRLAKLYAARNDFANAAKSWLRSADLYRQRVELQPDDARLLADFGTALQGATKTDEAESVLRKAVRLAPKEPQCLLALGRFLDAAARDDINDPSEPSAGNDNDLPSSSKVALAQRRLHEADGYFELAVAAAPDESEVYFRRAMHRCLREMLLNQIRVAAGEPRAEVDQANNYFSPAALADLQNASRLNPRDYTLIGSAAIFEIYSVVGNEGRIDWSDFAWSSLPDKSQSSLREAITRLDDLAQDTDAQLASGALEVLGVLQGPVLHQSRNCIASLRRAVALDPSREQAWEMLIATLAQSRRYDELLAACRQRVQQNDSARARLLLAKACEKLNRWDESEFEITEALKQDPNNFTASLSLAAVLLRRSRDEELLPEANSWLTRSEHLLNQLPAPQRGRQQIIDFTLTRSIYFALTDEFDAARQWAQAVIAQDRDNHLAQDILSAMDY